MVFVHYLRPRALVTLGVLSLTGICDLLRVVLADGSTTAFLPRFLLGAGDVCLPSTSTSSVPSPVASAVNPARRSPIRDVRSAPDVAGLALRGFGIDVRTSVPLVAGPQEYLGFFCGDLPSAKSSSTSSSVG